MSAILEAHCGNFWNKNVRKYGDLVWQPYCHSPTQPVFYQTLDVGIWDQQLQHEQQKQQQ